MFLLSGSRESRKSRSTRLSRTTCTIRARVECSTAVVTRTTAYSRVVVPASAEGPSV